MYKFLTKNGQLLAFGLGAVVTLIFLAMVIPGLEEFNLMSKEEQALTTIFNFGLSAAIFLVIVAGIAAVVFGVYHTVTNPKGSLKGLVGVAVLLAIFFIIYLVTDPETSGSVYQTMQEFDVSAGESKFIGAALATSLILAVGGVVAFIGFEFINLFK